MALGNSSVLTVTMASGAAQNTKISMTIYYQHGLRGLRRPWDSTEFLVVTGAMNITPAPVLCMAMDPDITLGRRLGLGMSMVPCDSAGHSRQHDPAGGMALDTHMYAGCSLDFRHLCGLWKQPGSWTFYTTRLWEDLGTRHGLRQQPGLRCGDF